MKQNNIFGLATALSVMLLGPAAMAGTSTDDAAVAKEIREFVSRVDHLGFDGVVLVARGNDVLFAEGYGLANRDSGLKWSPDVISTVGSITKQFTGAAILKLEEQGKLSTDDLISKYFENVPPDKAGITLHHLLTHSSGIQDLPDLNDFDPIGREEFVKRAMAQDLEFEPGSRYRYSNAGYSLLGAIIEQLTGAAYEVFVHDTFFVPLGMKHTGYKMMDWSPDRVAHGYMPDGEDWGTILSRPMAADGPYWVLRANGGIHSTVKDMHTWGLALIEGRVLSPESMTKLWTPFVDESNGAGNSYYGYGWSIIEAPDGTKVVMHNGGNRVLGADFMLVPSANLIMIAQSNVISTSSMVFDILERAGRRIVLNEPLPVVPQIDTNWRGTSIDQPVRCVAGDGAAIALSADSKGITVETLDQKAFWILHGTGEISHDTLAACTSSVEEFFAGIIDGNYAPLQEAYGGDVSLDRLEASYGNMRRMAEEQLGPYKRFRACGSAPHGDHIDTAVEIEFENGSREVIFVWTDADPPGLQGRHGVSGLTGTVQFLPEEGGAFVHFEPNDFMTTRIELIQGESAPIVRINGVEFRASGKR